VENKLGPYVPDKVNHDILPQGVADVRVIRFQHVVPFLSPNEESLAVSLSLVQELRPHLESHSKASYNTLVLVTNRQNFVFVYFKPDCNFTFLNEVDLSEFIELFVDISALFIKNWL
jgi:hypothetical protein